MGNSSPTRLRTLLILANLYDVDDTDREIWLSAIESHPSVFSAFLSAVAPVQLESWHESLSMNVLKDLTLALLNQQVHQQMAVSHNISGNHQAAVELVRELARRIDPALERRSILVARLIGTGYDSAEPDVSEALNHCSRALSELHDTPLLTRLIAVANHCNQSEEVSTDECALLLSLDESEFRKLCESTDHHRQEDRRDNTSAELSEALSLINLKSAMVQLAGSSTPEVALRQLTQTCFDTPQIRVFLQNDGGWTDGAQQLTSAHSIIVQTAERGKPISSAAHQMTVVDEQAIEALASSDGLAIPILMSSRSDSCAAVVLVGLSKSRLMELAGRTPLIEMYQALARTAFTDTPPASINLDDLNLLTREIIHEANNPLSTVQNYLKVLSIKLGAEHEALATLETISAELYRTAGIIERLRDLQSIPVKGSGQCQVNAVVSDLATLFDQASEQIQFNYDFDSADPVALISQEDLKQVISNLIKNAVESQPAEGQVSISTTGNFRQAGSPYIEISISDNGPGISPEIDDVFSRGHTTKDGNHTGEGLAVVRELTERCGGFVSYRSSSRGTEFRLTIPEQ